MNVLLALRLIGISTVVVADEPLMRAPRGCFPSPSSPDTMDHL